MLKLSNNLYSSLNIYKLEHLLQRFEFPLDPINNILKDKDNKVNKFIISMSKENGTQKERTIYNPHKSYKALLRKINKKILNKTNLPEGVCGAVINKSLFDMVNIHCSKEAIYQVDLENFFPNISDRTILNVFLKMNTSKEVAKLLTELVTFDGRLPQGFPTSPMVANLVAIKLDFEQLQICKKFNISRTRWIDDIVFSGRIKDLNLAIPKLQTSIKKNHFKFNGKKEKYTRRKGNPEVVGLSLKKHRPYIPLRIINRIEEFIAVLNQNGFKKLRELYPEDFKKTDIENTLKNKIRYIERFDKKAATQLKEKLESANKFVVFS